MRRRPQRKRSRVTAKKAERLVILPDFSHERALGCRVAGVDEAGRGPLAGPVVAAAVVFSENRIPPRLNDSKKLTPAQRESCFAAINELALSVGIGQASVAEIDALNILNATLLAMQRAVAALAIPPEAALIDGNRAPKLACPVHTVVKGDAKCLSIAAAGIVAKVTRDRIMRALGESHPGYGLETHMGYGTAAHLAALERLGPTPHHRTSFAPVRAALRMKECA